MRRIVIHPDICNGKPVIEGTRITAQTILEFLAAGDSIEDVLDEYPSLTREDVLECMRLWVVWLRVGNMRRSKLHALLANAWPRVEELLPNHRLITINNDSLHGLA